MSAKEGVHMEERYTGKAIPRTEGMDKATGRAKYAGDYHMDNMLHVAVIRSPIAHGYVKCLDTSALTEDVIVFTGKDLAENIIADVAGDEPALADDHVRYHNEPVALVAADTAQKAREAAEKVKVICKPLPVIHDPFEALKPGSVKIHEQGNELVHFQNEKGDVEAAFSRCDVVVEDTFQLPVQDHGYMEPEASFAFMDGEGRLNVYTSTQNVYNDRRMVCHALGLPEEQVRIRAAVVGGGFGGKDGHTNQIFSALVAYKTGRPARCVFDRTETLSASYKRHSAVVHVKIGAAKDGRLLAFDGTGYLDTGAYAGLGAAVLGLFTEHLAGPYEIPNVRLESYLAYTNKMPAHAMRGFGAPQGAFATETLINRICEKIGMDPLEFRYKNALEKGSIGALGQKMEHCVDFKGALDLIRESDLWKERKANTDPLIGYGIAGGHLSCGLGKNIPDSAKVEILERSDGGYDVHMGLVDIGQGSTTAMQALAADALGVDLEQIHMIMADTDKSFECGSTAGSRSTYIGGNAILAAAKHYKEQKEQTGAACVKADGEAHFPESDKAFETGGFPHAMYTFIAQAVKLRLDPVTGEVELLDIFAATEAGRVVNPLSMAGQMQGGVAMSVGYALMEQCLFDEDGRLKNSDLSTYLLPTSMDIPHIGSENVDAYEESGPAGVKGAAEVATVSIAPAIANAVHDVTDIWPTTLPLDRYRILKALEEKKRRGDRDQENADLHKIKTEEGKKDGTY